MRTTAFLFFLIITGIRAADPPSGSILYQSHCAQCHESAKAGRIPSKATLQNMTPYMIMTALTSGVMKQQGASLSNDERWAVAHFLGSAAAAQIPASQLENRCLADAKSSGDSGAWTSWGARPDNWRFQSSGASGSFRGRRSQAKAQVGLWVAQCHHDALSAGRQSRPRLFGWRQWNGLCPRRTKRMRVLGHICQTSAFGHVDRSRWVNGGSVFWRCQRQRYGDLKSGKLLWQVRVADHPNALVTGTPAYSRGHLYVPVSSYEELGRISHTPANQRPRFDA
jgi:polyvinyl alcohol dehydrogenase (cytochrome)